MTSIQDVLEVYGNGIDADDFAAQLSQAMRRRIVGDPRLLSSHDQHVLASVGVPDADLSRPAAHGLVEQAVGLLTANSSALPTAAAAERLGRSVVRIRGAIANGSLYAVKVGYNWLIPPWQLDGANPLPHLRQIIAAIPQGTSAVTIERVMTQPTEELYLDGGQASPRQWLVAGQDPMPVIEIVQQLYAW